MNIALTLDNLLRRGAVLLAIVVIGLALGSRITSNFVIRGVADRRIVLPQEWLIAAEERFPDSARINIRLAESEIASGEDVKSYVSATTQNGWLSAENHAMKAVNLSPWDYQARRLLATAQELNGKQAEAENSLRAAVKLAPNHAELNWSFANLLLRRGKLEESFEPFRVAARGGAGLLPLAIETIWRSSGGNFERLKAFAGKDSETLLAVVKFLIEQKQPETMAEAVTIFNSIDKQAKVNSPQSPELISALMGAGQYGLAKTAWVDLVTATHRAAAPVVGSLIWNGGFEADPTPGLGHFDWSLRHNKYARLVIDRNMGRSGARSLRVAFTGLDTTTLRDQAQQAVVLNPGASYRLECYARAKDLLTPEGPRVAVLAQGNVIATSEPVTADPSDWQRLTVSFVAPSNVSLATVAVVRIPRFSYDEPTSGVVWFDDFTLVEQ